MSSRWSLVERFDITDEAGNAEFEARGHFGAQISLHDRSGQQVATIAKHMFSEVHDVSLGGQKVAEVRHTGFFGDRYEIDTPHGTFAARGRLMGGTFELARDGVPVAQMARQFALREKYGIDIADGEDPVLILALMLAVEAIHDERARRQR
jgi:uncharacterized protein YxjI